MGTGPGVLLPLLHVLARDRQADVALVPSDHDFRVSAKMRRALSTARRAARTGVHMVLIGPAPSALRATSAGSFQGWLGCGGALLEESAGSLGSGRASECLREVYERLTPADFSRDRVVASRRLRVAAMDGAGWSDCGTPEWLVAARGDKVGTLPAPRASLEAVA